MWTTSHNRFSPGGLQIAAGMPQGRSERYVNIDVRPEPDSRRMLGVQMRVYPKSRILAIDWMNRFQFFAPVQLNKVMALIYTLGAEDNPQRPSGWLRVQFHAEQPPEAPGIYRPKHRVYPGYEFPDFRTIACPQPPEADWGALFAIGRRVAVTGEPLPFLGWMEDYLPEPWSLLGTDPVAAVRALCPMPLYEGD